MKFGERLRVGDWVSWESQAAGSWTEKRGQIVAEIPAGISFWQWKANNGFDTSKYGRGWDSETNQRKEVSYLVAVPSKTGRGKPKLYWPLAWKLEKVDNP